MYYCGFYIGNSTLWNIGLTEIKNSILFFFLLSEVEGFIQKKRKSLPMLKILYFLLMFFGSCQCGKSSQVAALFCLGVDLAGVNPVFARF